LKALASIFATLERFSKKMLEEKARNRIDFLALFKSFGSFSKKRNEERLTLGSNKHLKDFVS